MDTLAVVPVAMNEGTVCATNAAEYAACACTPTGAAASSIAPTKGIAKMRFRIFSLLLTERSGRRRKQFACDLLGLRHGTDIVGEGRCIAVGEGQHCAAD